jgi:hypothetical protein
MRSEGVDVPPRGQEPKVLAADLAGGRRFVNSPAAIHHHGDGRGQRRCWRFFMKR